MDVPNVILIIVDTLRADYAKPLENALKKLGFISYKNAVAPASWTMPTHASIFTGLYPAFHGAHETKNKKGIDIELNTKNLLSFNVKEMEYSTYLLSANPFIRPEFGFSGFDNFYPSLAFPSFSLLSINEENQINMLKNSLKTKFGLAKILISNRQYRLLVKAGLSYILNKSYIYATMVSKKWPRDKGAKSTIRNVRKALGTSSKEKPKFVFINFMEVHEPYFVGDNFGVDALRENLKTNRIDLNLIQKWRENYFKEVKYVTERILELMAILKKENLFDSSLIIVTSDHGQLLGEHGRIGHGTFLYDELLKVPLLIRYPVRYRIEHVQNKLEYINLVTLKAFILSIIDNKLSNDDMLYSDTVFAESYGIPQRNVNPSNKQEKKNIEQLEKYRIAIYYKNFKGVFNVTDWKFEEIISYDPSMEVTEDIVKHMKKEVIKFLKTATIAKVPKIKL